MDPPASTWQSLVEGVSLAWLAAGLLAAALAVLARLVLRVPFRYNLRSLRARWVSSLMTLFGTALVVWACVLAFGLAAGLDHTLEVSADPHDLLVLRKGANAETSSVIEAPLARQIASLDGIASDNQGQPLCSPELVVVVNTPRRGNAGKANLLVRGITPAAREVRSGYRLVAGREARPGVREAVTSRTIAQRFRGAGLGEELEIFGGRFRVVGLFEAGQSAAESEVWTDLKVLGQVSKRSAILSSVQVRAAGRRELEVLRDRLENDERFGLKAQPEHEYFSEQADAGMAIKIVGRIIAFFLTGGALFAVANTMYGAVASRAREIGTLRVLGFSRTNVLAAFLFESLMLCLAGGVLGCLALWPLNGLSTGTANWQTFSEITFAFRFGPKVMLQGAALAVIMGVAGGLLPALRAVRMPLVAALREV